MLPAWYERPLSAVALRIFQSCPRRFRLRYVDGLFLPSGGAGGEEERRAMEQGERFHLMARRYYAGLDPAAVADPVEQRGLNHWLGLMQGFLPRTFDRSFHPELELHLNRPDLRLMAKFDLLVVDPDGRATLFDWKTERRAPRRAFMESSPQTLVYRYMLCAAGGAYSPLGRFSPEQVSMIYWNPNHPHRWDRLAYSEAQYRQDEEQLLRLAARVRESWPEGFFATDDSRVCARCEYRTLCHGRWNQEQAQERQQQEQGQQEQGQQEQGQQEQGQQEQGQQEQGQ